MPQCIPPLAPDRLPQARYIFRQRFSVATQVMWTKRGMIFSPCCVGFWYNFWYKKGRQQGGLYQKFSNNSRKNAVS